MKILRKMMGAAAVLLAAALTACSVPAGPSGGPAAQSTESVAEPAVTGAEPAAAPADESAEPAAESTAEATESAATPDAAGEQHALTMAAVSRSVGDLWLLAGGELAGMTEDGMDLEGITEDTKIIGTVTNPSLEAIAALSPDLVLLSGELPTHKKLSEELEARDIRTKMISVNSFADYDLVMQELTDMTGRKDRYKENVTDVGEEIGRILESASEKELLKGKYLALRISATKNKALKNDYFACEIFNAFGLENIAGDNSAFDELNPEAVLDADPDIIFVIEQGKSDEARKSFAENFSGKPLWQELTAVKSGHVFDLPKDYFQYKPNAEWDEAYRYVMEILDEE